MVLYSHRMQSMWRFLAIFVLIYGTQHRKANAFRSHAWHQRQPILSQQQPKSLKSPPICHRLSTTILSCGLLDAIQNVLGGGNSEAFTKATASHILLQSKSPGSRDQLENLKMEIGDDPFQFSEAAAQYSDCSSASKGGDLGEFGKGQMAKEFERVVFDPKTSIGVVQGPIATEFGYHLILVKERS